MGFGKRDFQVGRHEATHIDAKYALRGSPTCPCVVEQARDAYVPDWDPQTTPAGFLNATRGLFVQASGDELTASWLLSGSHGWPEVITIRKLDFIIDDEGPDILEVTAFNGDPLDFRLKAFVEAGDKDPTIGGPVPGPVPLPAPPHADPNDFLADLEAAPRMGRSQADAQDAHADGGVEVEESDALDLEAELEAVIDALATTKSESSALKDFMVCALAASDDDETSLHTEHAQCETVAEDEVFVAASSVDDLLDPSASSSSASSSDVPAACNDVDAVAKACGLFEEHSSWRFKSLATGNIVGGVETNLPLVEGQLPLPWKPVLYIIGRAV